MKLFKSHFRYSKNQRNGVFSLLLIIATLQFTFHFYSFDSPELKTLSEEALFLFQKERDSLLQLRSASKRTKVYPFNPNFMSDYKGYQLGMSLEEIDRLHLYRAKGKFINSSKKFQEVTKISDSLLKKIKVFFRFPNFKGATTNTNEFEVTRNISPPTRKGDINLATVSDLEKLPGIGKILANRIVNYREKLQGFTFEDQLTEVWNLSPAMIELLLDFYGIYELPKIDKLDINQATFKDLLAIAYIDYELTKKILQYRIEVAEIQSIEELKKIDGFPVEKFDRIALYLGAK